MAGAAGGVPGLVVRRAIDLVSGKPAKPIRRLLAGTKDDADVVVLDCPPGLSAVVEAVASVADVLLVPVVPEPLPFRALARFSEFLADTRTASGLTAIGATTATVTGTRSRSTASTTSAVAVASTTEAARAIP